MGESTAPECEGGRLDIDASFPHDVLQRVDVDVLDLNGEHVAVARELSDRRRVAERAELLRRGDRRGGRGRRRVQDPKLDVHVRGRDRHHAAELAAAEDADRGRAREAAVTAGARATRTTAGGVGGAHGGEQAGRDAQERDSWILWDYNDILLNDMSN